MSDPPSHPPGKPPAAAKAPPPATASGTAAQPAAVQGFSPLPTGARIGDLVIQSVLGAGEFGITYLAEHAKRSKRYALKEFFPRAMAIREGVTVRARPSMEVAYKWGLERFLSEARALQKVKHDSLVALLGVTELNGTGYIGMSYEPGTEWGIWLHGQKGIAPQAELDKLLDPILAALEAAHAGNVLHLDLSPDSIIIRDNGTPVLVDFGVFRVGLRRRLPPAAWGASVYAAPELQTQQGGPVGPWCDIYSMAALLYQAVTGKPPLPYKERAANVPLEPALTAAHGDYRRPFLAAIDAGLRMDPNTRPRTIALWRAQLQGKASFAIADRSALIRAAVFGVGGFAAGTIVSLLLTGMLRSDCSGVIGCAGPYIMPLGTIGAVAAVWSALTRE